MILWGDTATSGGSEIYNILATPTIDHSIIQGSGGSGSWDSSLGTDGGGNLDADPLLGSLADNGGLTDTMALSTGSPAIDAGMGSGAFFTDILGNPKVDCANVPNVDGIGDIVKI